ncbi:MAG: diacylglycerol/polyprenol kinase family protein [Elainellaceae cyanobacterium]
MGGWLGGVGGVALVARRWGNVSSETLRKIVHIGTGNVIILAWLLQVPAWMGIVASILFSSVTLLSYRFPILPLLDSVGRKSLGTFFYALSIGILMALFWAADMPHYVVLGVLIMSWGDGLAALVGQRWGRHQYQVFGMKKSWEGSMTMAIASAIVSVLVLGSTYGFSVAVFGIAIAIALAATALESFSTLGIDNLTVPLGSAAIAYWLTLGMNISP